MPEVQDILTRESNFQIAIDTLLPFGLIKKQAHLQLLYMSTHYYLMLQHRAHGHQCHSTNSPLNSNAMLN